MNTFLKFLLMGSTMNCHIEITPEIVRVKLGTLNPTKSPGYDLWHPYFLKELAGVIYKLLSILFKKSLKEGAHSSWIRASNRGIQKRIEKRTWELWAN